LKKKQEKNNKRRKIKGRTWGVVTVNQNGAKDQEYLGITDLSI